MRPGDRILYVSHPVSWQDGGTYRPHANVEEEWLSGVLLDLTESPPTLADHHAAIELPGVPVAASARVQPDNGEPPFHVDARCVRTGSR